MRNITKDAVDQSVVIRIVDSTDGTPETGVIAATAGLDLFYRREGAAVVSLTESDLAGVNSAHSDGGIKHIGGGYYRVDLPDAAVATGADGVLVAGTVTGMVVIGCYVPLVSTAGSAPSAADVADAVWDEAMSGHVAVGSFGQRLAALRSGTAQAGAAKTITLDAGASATDNLYNGATIQIVGGTGAGQTNAIADYVGATKVATVAKTWATNPDATSTFVIIPNGTEALLYHLLSEGDDADRRSIAAALSVLVNAWAPSGSYIQHYKSDGATAWFKKAITVDAALEPISQLGGAIAP